MNEFCIERSLAAREASSLSAAPAPIEHAAVDDVYFQNGLLKANISWIVANGETCRSFLLFVNIIIYFFINKTHHVSIIYRVTNCNWQEVRLLQRNRVMHLVFISSEEVMFLSVLVSWFVCYRDYAKTTEPFFTNFGWKVAAVAHGQREEIVRFWW